MRYLLKTDDVVAVVDWADVGDLFYGAVKEDGERPVLRPDREARIQLTTDYGHRYTLVLSFGDDFDGAERMAAEIVGRGVVNLARWMSERNVYGSDAYINEGDEAWTRAWEREMA